MEKHETIQSVLDNYKLTFLPGKGGGWDWQGGGMARAVIELSSDIRRFLTLLSRRIAGFEYNPRTQIAAFNLKGMPITIIGNKITIYNTKNEAVARDVMKSLRGALDRKEIEPER